MPNPRHARPEDTPSPVNKSNLFRPNVTKKRSTTEPSVSSERSSSKSDASEKKRSKVASLRSKFSLKDIGKEFRKEISIPPLSNMPKLGGGSGNGRKSASSDGDDKDQSTQSFSEAKLYVPKMRQSDVHPNSAPPQTSEFRDASSMDKRSVDSIISCPSMQTPTQISGEKNGTQFKHNPVHNNDAGQSTYNERLETLLLNGSSPLAHTGEFNNTGQSELIKVQDRVSSMKAENNQSTMPRSPSTPPPIPSADAATYSPSVYETPKAVAKKASKTSLFDKKDKKKVKHPFIVDSSDYKAKARLEPVVDDDQSFLDPREPPLPPLLPIKSRAREDVRSNGSTIIDEVQYFAGVTSHGGYAPPPPHPGYQNTVTLEQQLASHVDSIHHHMSTAVNRLTRTYENGSNWTIDQILKQLDSMNDLFRVINARAATQAEMLKELSRTTQVREEALVMEIARLRVELGDLILSTANHSPVPSQPQFQGQKRFQNQKKKPRPYKTFDNRKSAAERFQESNTVPGPEAETNTGNELEEKTPGDSVPMPTATFHTPKPQADDDITPAPMKLETPGKAGESSGSSSSKAAKLNISAPMPMNSSLPGESSKRKSLESSQPSTPHRESARKPRNVFSSDDLKTPKKKGGMFSFRRKPESDNQSVNRFQILTPRRSKEGRSTNSQGSQGPRFTISTSSKARGTPFSARSIASATSSNAAGAARAGEQIRREESPSLIHPALRTPHQKQIMADRERHLAQLNRHIQKPGHGHPLRASHSHHNFGTNRDLANMATAPSFVSYDGPDHRYASGMTMSTSTSSFRGMNHCQPNMHYPQPAVPSLSQDQGQVAGVGESQLHPQPLISGPGAGPSVDHGHGPCPVPNHSHGQFDGLEWYGGGDGQMEVPVFPNEHSF
ncbi:hypothetical protein BDV18DRAFT_158749 [Aspergillus unguis]